MVFGATRVVAWTLDFRLASGGRKNRCDIHVGGEILALLDVGESCKKGYEQNLKSSLGEPVLLEQSENTSRHRRARWNSIGVLLALKYDDGGLGDPGLCWSRSSWAEQEQMMATGHVNWSTLSGASRSVTAQ